MWVWLRVTMYVPACAYTGYLPTYPPVLTSAPVVSVALQLGCSGGDGDGDGGAAGGGGDGGGVDGGLETVATVATNGGVAGGGGEGGGGGDDGESSVACDGHDVAACVAPGTPSGM